ncbi:MAG: coproporphyrinogen dehydrogenase HemZ [Oscillospiraceae bacterium]|nr:coproporphyrinogen dehydrogenase HemZ [Oscillospiraceae bacterium]
MNFNELNHPYRYAVERIVHGFEIYEQNADVSACLARSASAGSKLEASVFLYDELVRLTGRTLPWGIFTGVHPIRFIRENRHNLGEFRISPERLQLADEIMAVQDVRTNPREVFHLYVGIPFCPSRCKYCSFVSESVTKPSTQKLITPYVDALCREIAAVGEYSAANGLTLEAMYVGGGTPTMLPVTAQSRLYAAVSSVSAQAVREYTVEAGRPETLTDEVLAAIKAGGATRISINPQTMNDETLRIIGREHNSTDIYKAYEKARRFDFAVINMDLIAGLPGEDCSCFTDSLNKIIALEPENITVHSLAVKRGAAVKARSDADFTLIAHDILTAAGYVPYYLYRQSNCAGDNIGYTRGANVSRYNVLMMDESSTVLAAGCGGATRVFMSDGSVRKHYNFKYAHEYISRFDEVMNKFEKIHDIP